MFAPAVHCWMGITASSRWNFAGCAAPGCANGAVRTGCAGREPLWLIENMGQMQNQTQNQAQSQAQSQADSGLLSQFSSGWLSRLETPGVVWIALIIGVTLLYWRKR